MRFAHQPAPAPNADRIACDYAQSLLTLLGMEGRVEGSADHPALAWRRAGLMAVTGTVDGQGLVPPLPLASMADGAMLALATLAPEEARLPSSGALLLGERARLLGLSRRGRTSANGSCHIFDCADGRIALNLAREDDWQALPALLFFDRDPDRAELADLFRHHQRSDLLARGIELGLAIADDRPPKPADSWFAASGISRMISPSRRPRVIDFSSLWAGPLAGSLLAMMGAEVIKVESQSRPDGARLGHAGFFDLLNGMKQQVAIDFSDREKVAGLLSSADTVIEASRPHALQNLGISAEDFVSGGGLWISITGHGREPSNDRRVAFGDDAAVEAGLSHVMKQAWGTPMFAGDAIADPMTGIHAALLAWAFWSSGKSALVDISLIGTMRWALGKGHAANELLTEWQDMADRDASPLYSLR